MPAVDLLQSLSAFGRLWTRDLGSASSWHRGGGSARGQASLTAALVRYDVHVDVTALATDSISSVLSVSFRKHSYGCLDTLYASGLQYARRCRALYFEVLPMCVLPYTAVGHIPNIQARYAQVLLVEIAVRKQAYWTLIVPTMRSPAVGRTRVRLLPGGELLC